MNKFETSTLGRRGENYKGDLIDYVGYERRLAEIMERPWARAFVLRGGIQWRRAVESIGLDKVIEIAAKGPSGAADAQGIAMTIVDENGKEAMYVDDEVDDDEKKVVCGEYEVATGKPNNVIDEG